jgi:hypothetical protein
MYYGDTVMDNDEQRFRLERASRKAALGWRFRHLKSREIRLFRAALTRVRRLLSERLDRREPGVRPVRERLSY